MTTPKLANDKPYIHGATIYDINGNDKPGDYIASNYTVNYLDAFSVTLGDEVLEFANGWYLCPIGVPLKSGFEYAINKFYDTLSEANEANLEKRRNEIEAKIAELQVESRSLK